MQYKRTCTLKKLPLHIGDAREVKMFQIELLIELLLREFSAVHAYSIINTNAHI